jgi:hypothetical protein
LEKQIQKAGDNVNQNQISTQNNFNISINGDIIPVEYIKLFQSISSTFVTEKEFESFQERLNESLIKIDNGNRTPPSLSLWGAAVDLLKWNLSEQQKHIRDMFINILTSDVDKTKKNIVQPSFIEIVNQLSANDAIFLESINDLIKYDNDEYVLYEAAYAIQLSDDSKESDYDIFLFKVLHLKEEWKLTDDIIIDNLKRLNIISLNVDENYSENKYFAEDKIKLNFDNIFSCLPSINKIRAKPYYRINNTTISILFSFKPDISKIIVTNAYCLKFTAYGKAFMKTIFE